MMDWTDRHARYLYRLMTRHTLLYTEMVTTGAILHGDRQSHLGFDVAEQPLALQLGGSHAGDLARCARIGETWGYREINLNCGCPSDRVQEGAFGACLMKQPDLMADLVRAMKAAVNIPVTVKTRIGVDDQDSASALIELTGKLIDAGVDALILHARKAWLTGLSPAQNRTIPALDYPRVYRIKQLFPELEVVINGGIESVDQAASHLQQVDGVMMGRAAYKNPWQLSRVDQRLFGTAEFGATRRDVLEDYFPYVEAQLNAGTRLAAISRHLLGLYQGVPGARQFRRMISERAHRPDAGLDVLLEAVAHLEEESVGAPLAVEPTAAAGAR